jgi:preprotein translocase subunit SecA
MAPLIDSVRSHERACVTLTNDQLRRRTVDFKIRVGNGESLDDILPEAFAVVSEATKRVAGMRPFDVQILGGAVLHQGKIAEMVTGEGKTLVSTMPAYLNALTGKGVHIVTVNDYLARRDYEWMKPIHSFLGLTVGVIQHDMHPYERQAAYRADITYGTNNEFGFDYLRDNLEKRPDLCVQRSQHYAIIDEIDSILVDEARTPLIISGRPEKPTDLYYKVDEAVRKLREGVHYEVEEKGKHVIMSEEGMAEAERLMGIENLYMDDSLGVVHMIEQSIRAHHFYKRDDEYVVKDSEILIVDEFTGRTMEGRRWGDGLHQAIEAKEGVAVQFEQQTVASITYQNLFLLYDKICGMTGTATTEAVEFDSTYGLEVVPVPTNLPLIREDLNDLVFATEDGKFRYVAGEIERIHEKGRPVLVGTVSIEKSERMAEILEERGIDDYQVLNAKHHEREAAIISNAGKRGAITIATNMAGRGTDIKLGEGVREAGGLAIIGTERHDSRRIDNQLRGRCGRQGDPGTTQFFLSLEDEVARLFGGDRVKKLLNWFGSQEEMDDQPLDQRMVSRSIERAQSQVENYNFEARKQIKKYDDVMNKQRQVIYTMRREVLEDKDVTGRLHQMFEDTVADIVDYYAPQDLLPDEWDLEGLEARFKGLFNFEPRVEASDEDGEPAPLAEDLYHQVLEEYARREAAIGDEIREQLKDADVKNINDDVVAKIARKYVHGYELMAILRSVDDRWIEHLYSMDYLKESVRLRAYGQRDPLLEFKSEGFEMFQALMASIEEAVISLLFRITDPEIRQKRRLGRAQGQAPDAEDPFAQIANYHMVASDKEQDRSFASFDTSRFALGGQPDEARAPDNGSESEGPRPKRKPVRHTTPTVGPNDPCTCGSGKKYKKCCGRVSN